MESCMFKNTPISRRIKCPPNKRENFFKIPILAKDSKKIRTEISPHNQGVVCF